MKKIIIGGFIAVIFLFVLTGCAQAKVERVPCPWNPVGTYVIAYTCTSGCSGVYTHTMNVTSMDFATGNFSGTGYYNVDLSYTWTVTGNVTGSAITFHILYTGTNAGYTIDATGIIANDGTMSGTAIGPGQNFTWVTTSGAATHKICKNHGQCIKEFKEYIKKYGIFTLLRCGMPIQSKGHEGCGGFEWHDGR